MSALSIGTLRSLDAQQLLNRLLRRQTLDVVAAGIRLSSVALGSIALAILIYSVITDTLSRQGLESALEGRVSGVVADLNRPPSPVKADKDISSITQRAIFGTLGRAATPAPAATPPPTTPLSLTLIGTFLTGGEKPYAIIEDKKKQNQDVFNIGQSIFSQATLKSIYEDRVEIEREGKIEVLKLDDLGGGGPDAGGGVASSGEDEFVVDEAELDKGLENLPLLLTQARAVPYFKEGRSIGLRLFAIKSGSLYEKIGLKNGDILKTINGNSLGDISQALKLFEQLKQERSIGLVLERDKQDREFKYQIR
jgi:general secretion pathway protein C